MKTFMPGDELTFKYLNHRGETRDRRVIFLGLDHGDNEWYTKRGWFMRCMDLDKNVHRSFYIENIIGDPKLLTSVLCKPIALSEHTKDLLDAAEHPETFRWVLDGDQS